MLTLAIALFSLIRITQIDGVIQEQNSIRTEQLERLYTAREALGQTGLAARNAYVFTSDADAKKSWISSISKKPFYLNALNKMEPLFKGNAEFDKVSNGLRVMAEELNRPRKYRDSGKMEEFGKFLVTECSPLRRQIVDHMAVVVKSVQSTVESKSAEADKTAHQSVTIIFIITGIALLLSIALSLFITGAITRPLN